MDRDLNPRLPDYGLLLIQAGPLLVDLNTSRALKMLANYLARFSFK